MLPKDVQKPLEKAIRDEAHKSLDYALKTILRCAESTAKFWKAMKGLGMANTALSRLVITRVEIDMHHIKGLTREMMKLPLIRDIASTSIYESIKVKVSQEYYKKYEKTLNNVIHSETSVYYITFLLHIFKILIRSFMLGEDSGNFIREHVVKLSIRVKRLYPKSAIRSTSILDIPWRTLLDTSDQVIIAHKRGAKTDIKPYEISVGISGNECLWDIAVIVTDSKRVPDRDTDKL
ncbi:Uncharacterized protein TCM_023669 [Theobroma cacao]|uniref:Uncharacterized protein n=1 Tax=Theobroma cacao TaxID=3641 RepID=A0A061EUE9_THECC|nr:Uncharacterized protein TCM_023669 [Theobroma cacao]